MNNKLKELKILNELTWLKIAHLSELMNENKSTIRAFEAALRINPFSEKALFSLAIFYRNIEKYLKVP
jgi:hypothetical protein